MMKTFFAWVIFTTIPTPELVEAEPLYEAQAKSYIVEVLASHLPHPWAVAFLPDSKILITERQGYVDVLDRGRVTRMAGTPDDFERRGGAVPFDLMLDKDNPNKVYACYARRKGDLSSTVVAIATLDADRERFVGWRVIAEQGYLPFDDGHFWGCRVAQSGTSLFVAFGARVRDGSASTPLNYMGKTVEIERPNTDTPKLSIISSGHRNPEGIIIQDGTIFEAEHGPLGGDKLEIVSRGANYGWPEVGHGLGYDGRPVMEAIRRDDVRDPLWYWSPSIAPSGLMFYDGKLFQDWSNSFFVGALAGTSLRRLEYRDGRIMGEQIILAERHKRIRDVREGPDGAIYVLTDEGDGELLKITPSSLSRGSAY